MTYTVVEMKHPIATPNPEGNGATTWSEWLVVETNYNDPGHRRGRYTVDSHWDTEAEAEARANYAYATQER